MLSVLIVDDNAAFRKVAEKLLIARGLRVAGEASTCAEGRQAMLEHRPDGVLLDISLPDGTGYDVARGWQSTFHKPVVVLTSTDECQLDQSSLASLGVRAFVRKQDLTAADLGSLFAG